MDILDSSIGRYYDSSSGHYRYNLVVIGALNHYWLTDNGVKKEYKAKYSNMGEVIDAYAPASGTLGATNSTTRDSLDLILKIILKNILVV